MFSLIFRECFPLPKILLLANSNHSPEGNFPWLNEVPQVQWTAEEMNKLFPTCKTITGKEELKHLAFFSLENVKQRVPQYGAGFEVQLRSTRLQGSRKDWARGSMPHQCSSCAWETLKGTLEKGLEITKAPLFQEVFCEIILTCLIYHFRDMGSIYNELETPCRIWWPLEVIYQSVGPTDISLKIKKDLFFFKRNLSLSPTTGLGSMHDTLGLSSGQHWQRKKNIHTL